jgi:cation diffusion facilitator family transporter
MHTTDLARWKHGHDFNEDFSAAEKNTRRVLVLAALMMAAEIVFGLKFHSLALFADGLHMGTHVTAFLITVLAYFFARRHSGDGRFSFGTGKFGVLGAFTSAIVLGGVGLVMAGESI